jgi:hypothetical protein
MTPEVERFLDLATRPLEASPGDREEARGELMSRKAHGGVPYELLDLGESIARLEAAKPPKPGLRRSLLLSGAILLTAAVVAATAFLVWEIILMSQAGFISNLARYSVTSLPDSNFTPVLKHARSTAPALPLGLHPRAGTLEETSEALEKSPEDLAMLQEHILRRLRDGTGWKGFTPEEQETIDRLDPDNALWSLIQLKPSLSKATGYSGYYHGVGSTVTSEPDFEEALRLFSEATSKPAYFDRSDSLKRRQLDAFPPARSLSEFMIATGFTGLVSPPFDYSGSLGTLTKFHTTRLIAAGDKEGLVKFSREWKQLNKIVVGSPESGETDYSGVFYQLTDMGRSLGEAFDKLGMAVEKAGVEGQMKVLERLTTSPPSLPKEITETAGLRLESEGRLPMNLTFEEAIPSRRVEFSFFDRITTTAFSCLALVFAGLVAFETCRRSRIVKGMARGLMPLFRMEDHAWIAALGIALPWLLWWSVSRMSPLGWREGGFEEPWPTLVWTLQFSAGLVFAAVMLLQTARWRWGVRGGFLGLGVPLSWIGWGVAALTALAIPVAGSLRYFVDSLSNDESGYFLLGVAGMVACGILWLLWQGVMTLFTPRSGALRPNLTMRAALPWALTGVATLLVTVVVSAMMERHWFAKDPLFPAWTSMTHVNALKERLAKETREAVRDL